jgi:hypothetical protein
MERIGQFSRYFEGTKLEERITSYKNSNEISFCGYLVKTILNHKDFTQSTENSIHPAYQDTVG